MKNILVFLAIVGLGFAAPKPKGLTEDKINPRDLPNDLLDFWNLLPVEKLQNISNSHLENDPAVAAVVTYLQGDEWKALLDQILAIPTSQDIIKYLNGKGIPVEEILGILTDTINLAQPGTKPDDTASLRPYLDEVEGILPIDDLVALLNDKSQNSPDFQDLYTEISSEDVRALVEEVRAIPEVQTLAQKLRDQGVRVDEALAVIYDFFGWGKPAVVKKSPRDLFADVFDFLILLPLDDIRVIVQKHLQNDDAYILVSEYLQGPEWAALVDEVFSKPVMQDFIQYLTDAGVPPDFILAVINSVFPSAKPRTELSLRPILDEIEGILPFDDLVALLNDKLQYSTDFQDLYVEISREDTKALVEEVRAIPEVQRLVQRLRDLGVKVDEALADIYAFLGWGEPKKFIILK